MSKIITAIAPLTNSCVIGTKTLSWLAIRSFLGSICSFDLAIGALLLISSVGYLCIVNCRYLAQTRLQRDRVTLRQLYNQQYRLILERQACIAQTESQTINDHIQLKDTPLISLSVNNNRNTADTTAAHQSARQQLHFPDPDEMDSIEL